MTRTRRSVSLRQNDEGNSLVFVAVCLAGLLGMAALAVDLGVLFTGRSEAQRAADAGAHAGAGVLLVAPGDEEGARERARSYAEGNAVRWADLEVLDQDIDVILDSQKVRVRVYRTEARENPVATLFARVLGFGAVDISAVAAAQAWPADATHCILPFAIPDRWDVWEEDGGYYRPAEADDVFNADDDRYIPSTDPVNGYYTGYGRKNIGDPILLKPASPSGTPQPGWYYPIRLPGSQGANDYRESIKDCWEPSGQHVLGDSVDKEPGNMRGPTRQGFRDILDDPDEQDIYWESLDGGGCGCPRLANPDGEDPYVGTESRRVRPVAMFNPEDWPDIDQGAKPVPIYSFGGIFIEDMDDDDNVWVRWMQYVTIESAPEWSDDDTLLRTLRIVE